MTFKQEDYKKHCVESYLFTQDPRNMDDFNKLIELTQKQTEIKIQIAQLRNKIKDIMLSCNCARAINLSAGKQLTISKSGTTPRKYEFDLERFKKEHPRLYKEYYTKCSGGNWSSGKKLVLKNLTINQIEAYQNPELSEYFRFKEDL